MSAHLKLWWYFLESWICSPYFVLPSIEAGSNFSVALEYLNNQSNMVVYLHKLFITHY